jgi:hypothetical protein
MFLICWRATYHVKTGVCNCLLSIDISKGFVAIFQQFIFNGTFRTTSDQVLSLALSKTLHIKVYDTSNPDESVEELDIGSQE